VECQVSLERQLDNIKPMPDEDSRPLLSDVAEWAKKVVPVQHGRGVNLRFVANTQVRVTLDLTHLHRASVALNIDFACCDKRCLLPRSGPKTP